MLINLKSLIKNQLNLNEKGEVVGNVWKWSDVNLLAIADRLEALYELLSKVEMEAIYEVLSRMEEEKKPKAIEDTTVDWEATKKALLGK